MDNKWSQYIQTSEELYRSRALRFHDGNKSKWLSTLSVTNGMKVLEIGCGGGLFCHRIKSYLPLTQVTGLDNDAGHIEYANIKSKELGIQCNFIIGNALDLPFSDNIYDICLSHTVIEHVNPVRFLEEQFRVLKPNGIANVLTVRSSLNTQNEKCELITEEEQKLLDKVISVTNNFDEENGVCKYKLSEEDILLTMEKVGFKNINLDYLTIVSYAPDNNNITDEIAIEQINVNRLFVLSNIEKALRISPSVLNNEENGRLIQLVNERFDKRINQYLSGKKFWDISASTILVAMGQKIR